MRARLILLSAGLLLSLPVARAQPAKRVGASGLAVPRFVSLKSAEVNVRQGPGMDHAISWIYRRSGLPVEIIAEFDIWRQIRDSDGATGWVLGNLLSGKRTALIAPWRPGQTVALRDAGNAGARTVAQLGAGLLATLSRCETGWCRVDAGRVSGYVAQDDVWGAYPGEKVE